MSLAERLAAVRAGIESACRDCGRDPSEITLIGVSKFHPPEAVREAVAAGLLDFGENYVQEWIRKSEDLADAGVRWHFTGHLQSNKARFLVGRVALIHSVSSTGLIDVLARQAEKQGVRQEILLELNLSGDPKKTGAPEKDLPRLIEVSRRHAGTVILRGLMCMGPLEGDAETARPVFRRLKELSGACIMDGSPPVLSMGMSEDYRVAIAEGATHIRIGTAIFGPRPPKAPAEA